MLDKNEVIEMLWTMNNEVYGRSMEYRKSAELAEQRGDDDTANYWYNASDEDWARSLGILDAIRAIEEM